ncbi:TIGR01777 family oxidoreductase [Flavobacterium hiemivividum]|uniref:TIGR01777 family protein n=1 Tax=Flavobacterium hiemivividum TaxID=2541734 RepID=A0A4V2Z125_9FLAO|nr:TIGR01777 family oxidoreductase [Flavobacterium hiemivividum]TDE03198.1 TIGR01777 family protein [Flavobacterium hiemivividum]
MKKNVLLTGGTGFVGKHLTKVLIDAGFTVSILSRSKQENTASIFYFTWDVQKQTIEMEAVLNADYIIHLAGANIAEKPWTTKRKEEIINSRQQSAQLIYSVLKKNDKKLDAFISASAIGIYGAVNGAEVCTEETALGDDFLGLTCQKWEAAADQFEKLGIRTAKVRTGLVLGENDGFLNKLTPIFKWRLGSALGSGKQYMPWIHVEDLCGIYLEAINNPNMSGPYNAAINDNTTNTSFSKALAKVYGYKIWLPNVPEFIIKLAMGEMAKIVLTGRRVSSDKVKQLGFNFKHTNLEETLKICIQK